MQRLHGTSRRMKKVGLLIKKIVQQIQPKKLLKSHAGYTVPLEKVLTSLRLIRNLISVQYPDTI